MSGREKPLILQNGMPIPQAYDKDLGDWTEYSTEHIKAIKAELALVKAELQTIKANQLSGDQKVQLSGTIVILHNGLENNPIVIPSLSRASLSFDVPMGIRKWHLFFGRHDWNVTGSVTTIDFDGYRLTSSTFYPFTPNISGVDVLEQMGGRFVKDRTPPKGGGNPMSTWAIMDAPVLFPGESHTVFFYNTSDSEERQIRPVILGEY